MGGRDGGAGGKWRMLIISGSQDKQKLTPNQSRYLNLIKQSI